MTCGLVGLSRTASIASPAIATAAAIGSGSDSSISCSVPSLATTESNVSFTSSSHHGRVAIGAGAWTGGGEDVRMLTHSSFRSAVPMNSRLPKNMLLPGAQKVEDVAIRIGEW